MKKQFEKYIVKTEKETFLIEEDLPEVGWYLYRIDQNGETTNDYLQDSKADAMEFALEEFQISIASWSIEK